MTSFTLHENVARTWAEQQIAAQSAAWNGSGFTRTKGLEALSPDFGSSDPRWVYVVHRLIEQSLVSGVVTADDAVRLSLETKTDPMTMLASRLDIQLDLLPSEGMVPSVHAYTAWEGHDAFGAGELRGADAVVEVLRIVVEKANEALACIDRWALAQSTGVYTQAPEPAAEASR